MLLNTLTLWFFGSKGWGYLGVASNCKKRSSRPQRSSSSTTETPPPPPESLQIRRKIWLRHGIPTKVRSIISQLNTQTNYILWNCLLPSTFMSFALCMIQLEAHFCLLQLWCCTTSLFLNHWEMVLSVWIVLRAYPASDLFLDCLLIWRHMVVNFYCERGVFQKNLRIYNTVGIDRFGESKALLALLWLAMCYGILILGWSFNRILHYFCSCLQYGCWSCSEHGNYTVLKSLIK